MFTCTPVVKKSKNGADYVCIEITFPTGYKKTVFLDKAEQFLAMSETEFDSLD